MVHEKKFNFNVIKSLFFILVLMVVMAGFGATHAGAGTIKMKFAHQNNVFDADQLLAETFKKLIEEDFW